MGRHMSLISKLRALATFGRGVVTTGLTPLHSGEDPIEFFREWFHEAERAGILMPEAMTLATASAEGAPAARIVLLKGVSQKGFTFFTNYGSRKSADLEGNPRAALVLHWAILERQVRIEGTVEKISREESQAYFSTRGRGSQLGAWASRQSEELDSRGTLEGRVREMNERFKGGDVPLPDFWGGFRVYPTKIEFWQGRASRLHDRLVYDREGDGWRVRRLYP
jgi:pyridoxamine 5'-phosphate oxidase